MSEKIVEKKEKKSNSATDISIAKANETPIVSNEKVADVPKDAQDETAKIKAEAERMLAEAVKAKAEAERMLAEAARVKAEAEKSAQKSEAKSTQKNDLSVQTDSSKSKDAGKKNEKSDKSKDVTKNTAELSKASTKKTESVSKKSEAPSKGSGTTRSLNDGLENTRSHGFLAQIGKIFKGELKSSVVDELEEILFTADIGVKTAEHLLDEVTKNLKDKGDGAAAMALLRQEVESILKSCEKPFVIGDEKPHVILTIGVNGAGKTTTLGKMASQLTAQGKKVLLIAGDTFRAAAIEQLEEWAVRCGCEIYRNKQGADPSGTIFDGIKYAKEHGFDVALADTAGRLNNKKDLIEELKKIHRVSGKAMSGAPHQVLLVLDATNGQNALAQARDFGEAIDFDGIILTKLDGTAKGGVLIGICEELKKPIYFIGIGEMIEDLRKFEAEEFVEALFLKE
ncbi:MAG: signal recognition particle-docking protein FtsY [Proteobacteria bacterium]|nr:signal recognition particle-docking protein FtsY [Pseudomonadota bacterium]